MKLLQSYNFILFALHLYLQIQEHLVYISFPSAIWLTSYQINSIINYQINTIMRLTKNNSPKSYTIYYLPQEIKETMVTEVSYLPITRERLEQFFKDAASKRKPKLVKT